MTTPVTNNTTPTSNVSNQTGNAGSSDTSTAISGLNGNYQDFLKLLTTQLQNQDPTAPADTNQLTQQIASLSQVEQQINTNSTLQQLVTQQTSANTNLQQLITLLSNNQSGSQVNDALGYIGKEVDAPGNQIDLSSGVGILAYNLPTGTSKATITILDSSGQTVYTADGTTIAGRNALTWAGTTNDGGTAPDGTYTFKVTATDSGGKPLTATTITTGVVNSADTANGVTTLSLGHFSLPINQVQSVRDLPTVASSS